jgi:hypothetical protein
LTPHGVQRLNRMTVKASSTLLTCALLLAAPAVRPAAGQTVRALVMTAQHEGVRPAIAPPGGRFQPAADPGYLVLVDRDDREVSRMLHNVAGLVAVQAPGAGQYRLRSERVGYRSVTSAPFELRPGEIIDLMIDMATEPIDLGTVNGSPAPACQSRPQDDPAMGPLWREIRKALVAAAWAGGRIQYEYIGSLFERDVITSGRVVTETLQPTVGPTVLGGETTTAAQTEYTPTYHPGVTSVLSTGPDYLLSETFQNDYCFTVVPPDTSNLLALRFAPRVDRHVGDIRGTFVMDLASGELRSLDYRAVNLAYDPEERTGGTVQFLRTPSGRWVVTSWKTRIPVLSRDNGDLELIRFRDVGGGLSWITTSNGEFVYRAPLAELRGTVVDEDSTPVAGARVALVGTDFVTETDPLGQFALQGLFDGDYGVSYRHPAFDTLSFAPPEQLVSLAPGRVQTVRLVTPPLETLVSPLCTGQSYGTGQHIITGVVHRAETGEGLPGARVIATLDTGDISVSTDSAGTYALCGMPSYVPIAMRAELDDQITDIVTLTFDDAGVNREVRFVSGIGSQNQHRPTTNMTWVEDFQLASLPVLPRATRTAFGFRVSRVSSTVTGSLFGAQAKGGYGFALVYEARFQGHWGLQFEGQWVQQGAFSPVDSMTMSLTYLKLPLLTKFWFSKDTTGMLSPYLLGGPVVGFDTRGKRGVPKGDLSVLLGGGVSLNLGGPTIFLDGFVSQGITNVLAPPLRDPLPQERRVPRFLGGSSFKNRLASVSLGLSFPVGRGRPSGSQGETGRRRPPGDIITQEEIIATDLPTAYEIVQRLHPQWLRSRGQVTIGVEEEPPATVGPVVYVNSSRRGDIEELRSIMATNIREIVYYNGRDASLRFGSGHGAGVIQVITGR